MKKRNTLAIVLLAVLLCMTAFAVPVLEPVENGMETTPVAEPAQETADLTADTGIIPPPGTNILTGTTEAETFESYEEGEKWVENKQVLLTNSIISISNVDSATIITNNSSKALQVNAVSGTYPYFQWKFNLDAERPLYVSVDVQTIGNSNFWFIGFNHKTLSDQKENFLYTNPTGIKWLAASGGNAKVIDVGSSTGSPVRRTFAVYSSPGCNDCRFSIR